MSAAVKVKASWLDQAGKRLDASYYGGPGQREARAFIASKIEKKELRELTEGGEDGIFIPSRFKRNYVDNPDFGYPYLTGTLIIQSDPLRKCKYLSRKHTHNIEKLLFKPDTIVITCSGNIGNTVYITDYFNGAIGSPDLVRIVPDKQKILPGYLYAFLCSNIGQTLISQSTYGSVVQHIEAHHLYNMPIPILQKAEMQAINDSIMESLKLKRGSIIYYNKGLNGLEQTLK